MTSFRLPSWEYAMFWACHLARTRADEFRKPRYRVLKDDGSWWVEPLAHSFQGQ